jgi:hypothetical protein
VGIPVKKNLIAYYISAHGYGHGVRSCDVIRTLNRLYPQLEVDVVSGLPPDFLHNRIGHAGNNIRTESFDVGMVQKDSIQVDVPATLAFIEQLYARREDLVDREISYLKERRVALVVVDIPALPLEAAELAGVPRMAIGNFGWDWIYSGFIQQDLRWERIADSFRNAYTKTDLLLRLPFSEPMRAFPRAEDISLVASPGISRRREISELLDCDAGKKWILISFTSLDWSDEALDRIERIEDYEFFTVYPLAWQRSNIHAVRREQIPFADVIASVDAVLSKPGFGILSDCAVNGKPLIFSDRSDFSEYFILESSIKKYFKYVHIPMDTLYRGDLKPSIDLIWDRPEAVESLAYGGDITAAHRIVQIACNTK